ncbi:MAG: Ig-like domain-containing protein, partial [Wenzhouxiangellaceae bacterium]
VNINLFDPGVEDNFTVPAGETLTADVQSNDRLPVNALGDPVDHLDVVDFLFVDNGALNQVAPGVTNQTGQFTFTPDPGFSGMAGFEYQTDDPDLGCQANTLAEILVTPVANQDDATIPGAVETCGINVRDNDLGSNLSVVSLTPSPDGVASIEPGDTLCFLPDPGFAGATSLGYTLEDDLGTQTQGLVSLTVQNQPPGAVDDVFETQANAPVTGDLVVNDNDPNGDLLAVIANTAPMIGSVTVAGSGVFTYTPNTGISGLDTFDYTVADGQGGESTATVDLRIVPVAPDQEFTGFSGQPLTGNLLDGAIGTGLSVVTTTQPATGTLTVQANGDFVFEVLPGVETRENFDYTIRDTAGSEASGTVTLGIELPPVAVPGLRGAPLGLLALLLAWFGWRRLD